MASFNLAPIGNGFQFFTAGGLPLNGGLLYTYQAGTTTPQATFTTNSGNVANANPIVLGADGRPANEIWLTSGISYKFVLTDSLGNSIATYDNLVGVNDTTNTASEWTATGLTPTYINATQFSVTGNQTTTYQVNRRIQAAVSGGNIYGSITVSSYAANVTTVTVVMDSSPLDNTLTAVNVGFLSATNPSVPASYAPLASPTFTGVPSAPTPTAGTSTQQIPTTSFVGNAVNPIYPVIASVASNALTIGLNATFVGFRSTTLTTGVPNTRAITSPISLTVPSGATLGTVNATQARLAILALDNAGAIELGIINLAGGNNLDETTLVSSTAVSAAATSNNVIYSTNARTNVPFRVVGFLDITEATAGTWATAPTLVQGDGGNALLSIGYGQIWQTVTRAVSTTYYNTTGRPIMAMISMSIPTGGGATVQINGISVGSWSNQASAILTPLTLIIPPGAPYIVNVSGGSTLNTWTELR